MQISLLNFILKKIKTLLISNLFFYLSILFSFASEELPIIGGFFTEFLIWRLVLWINLPISIIGVGLTLKFVPRSKRVSGSIALNSFFLFTASITTLIIAIMQGQSFGWSSYLILSLFFASLLLFGLFYYTDQKQAHPMFNMLLFKEGLFRSGSLTLFCMQFLLMITVFWSIFFQNILGYTPMQAGLITLGSTFPILAIAPLTGYINDKLGHKIPAVTGLGMISFCFLWFCLFSRKDSFWIFLPALLAFGSGLALVYIPTTSIAISSIPRHRKGEASGMLSTIRFLGASLGLALISSIFNVVEARAFDGFLKKEPQMQRLDPNLFEDLLSNASD